MTLEQFRNIGLLFLGMGALLPSPVALILGALWLLVWVEVCKQMGRW